MPLYPLGAVHIPYSLVNYTLNNIEERNVNMAKVRRLYDCMLEYTLNTLQAFYL